MALTSQLEAPAEGRSILPEKPLSQGRACVCSPRRGRLSPERLGACEVPTGLLQPPANPRVTFSSSVSRHVPEMGSESHVWAASPLPNTHRQMAASYGVGAGVARR